MIFRISKCIILSLLIKYNLYNDKILKILLKNIHSCGVIPTKIVQWSLPFLKLINIDENTYENCPDHDINYTKDIYKKEFYENIDDNYEIINIIGSGSIAQVYKIKDIKTEKLFAMKIIHPNAIKNFKSIKFYLHIIFIFFKFNKIIPVSLNDFLNQFETQLNMINESNNMLKFY